MKKIIIAMAAIAAAFTMASCNKEQLVEPEVTPVAGNDVITAFTESCLTKTSLEGDDTKGYEVRWSEGDSFKIGEETFTLIDGANTTTGKFQGTLPEGDGPFNAYYPATYNGIDWPTKQTYTEDNITGSPMIAEVVKGAESLSFKNVGGILRLTLKGTAKVGSIKVSAIGLDEIVLNCGSGVTLDNTNGTVFHIAMPEGEYSGVSIAVWTTDYDDCTKKLKEGTQLKIERSKITTASFTAEFPSPTPVASLTGAFSIADGKQICFSRGNLYYDDGFKFEAKQCNFHGYDSSSNTWGLFGWSTSATNYGMSTSSYYSTYSGTFYDWGKAIGDGKTWRTLTSDEWQYLFKTRPNADKKYGYGRVYGTYGLIILPDEFTDPMKNNGSGAFVPQISGKDVNGYSLGGNWEAMEAAGAVFLPIAGYRGESVVYFNLDNGMYWSSSADGEEKAYYLDFQAGSLKPAYSVGRHFGLSVRLVTNPASCTVKFDMNGHGTAPESLKGITYGEKITKPSDPVAEDFAFAGWYKDKDCTKKWNFNSDVVTANITLYAGWAIIPDGALSGLFTVNSSGKQVFFSKGNLWADGDYALHFEDNQYAFDRSYDYYHNSHMSHFTWSSSVAAAVGRSNEGAHLFCDKNNKVSVDGSETIYYALSTEEWQYLFGNHSMKWVKVNGVGGVAVAPDGFIGTIANTYADDAALAADKLVFLPEAGYRSGHDFYNLGEVGFYWSSSACNEERAYSISFYSDAFHFGDNGNRSQAYSIRLVAESNL